jgi:hypothetical protein
MEANPMGREATCHCQWGAESGQCKVVLETSELIIRGPIRRRVPIASLTKVSTQGNDLRFHVAEDAVTLCLGASLAQSWAKKIATSPPTLRMKLGITSQSNLLVISDCADEELKTAVEIAATAESKNPDLILAHVRTVGDLNHALDLYAKIASHPPIWIVYPKGPKKPIGETEIRNTLRRESFIDTKVASVSASLTALRFIKRG